MSKYTTEVRYICEEAAGLDHSVGYNDIDDVLTPETINKVMPGYPIFDESYRLGLNKKILEHFYTREIGFETVGLWKLKMRTRLNEIMPYYNKLYNSELLKFDPLKDVDLVTNKNGIKNTENSKDVNGNEEKNDKRNETKNENFYKDILENGSNDRTIESAKTMIENLAEELRKKVEEDVNKNANENEVGDSSRQLANNESTERDATGNENRELSAEKNGSNKNEASTASNTVNDKDDLQKYSDTPQGGVTGLLNGNYLTNATKNDASDTSVTNADSLGKGEYDENNSEDESRVRVESEKGVRAGDENEQSETNRVKTSSENEKSEVDEVAENERNGVKSESGNDKISDKSDKNATEEGGRIGNNGTVGSEHSEKTESELGSALSTEDYIERILGKRGGVSYSKMLMEWRDTFLNIDMMIINSLNDLFMGLW